MVNWASVASLGAEIFFAEVGVYLTKFFHFSICLKVPEHPEGVNEVRLTLRDLPHDV